MNHNPYLHVVGEPREMKGKGAPRSTVFGVLGHTEMSPLSKSLGGLVKDSKVGKLQKGTVIKHPDGHMNSDRHIVGPASKTHIPGSHFGMVPYPGHYMSAKGASL
jgi:hypothetical protein